MRLDKFLADMGVGTRSEIKKNIRKGGVVVNGVAVRDADLQVDADSEVVYLGEPVAYEEAVYYLMNKPAGVISASEDKKQQTVVDLIDERTRTDLFPVGRLDKDTEGLLIITNDGELAHRLLAPKRHVDKVYYARVTGRIDARDVARFEKGIQYDEHLTAMPAKLEVLGVQDTMEGPVSEILTTIREGKFHQIKKMVAALGEEKEVLYLKRLSMGPLQLDEDLEPGEYRKLTEAEIEELKAL